MSIDGYLPTGRSYPAWARQPFTFSVATDVIGEYFDKIIELQRSHVQLQLFRTRTLNILVLNKMLRKYESSTR